MEETKREDAVEAFGNGSEIYKALLVCAAFFRDVDVTEFGQLVCAVAGEEEVQFEEGVLTSDGRTTNNMRRAQLRDVWSRLADRLVGACGLCFEDSGGRTIVTFAGPDDRRDLLAHIHRHAPNFLADVSKRFWQSGLLFAPESSPQLVARLIALFGATLGSHHQWKRPEWLSDTLTSALCTTEPDGTGDLASLLRNDGLVLDRLTQLLRGLLDHDAPASMLDWWLGHFMTQGQPTVALSLVSHLRDARGVDFLHWLKRIADGGTPQVRKEVHATLSSHTRQSANDIADVAKRVQTWLPGADWRTSTLSNSNQLALQFLGDYSVESAESLAPDDLGAWPPRYPLFRALADQSEGSTLMKVLVPWLFHDALGEVFPRRDDAAVRQARAKVLWLWSCILVGRRSPHPEAERVFGELVTECGAVTSVDDREILVKTWRARMGSSDAPRALRGIGDEILQRLESGFRQLSPSTSPADPDERVVPPFAPEDLRRNILIGICGAEGAGKTVVETLLFQTLPGRHIEGIGRVTFDRTDIGGASYFDTVESSVRQHGRNPSTLEPVATRLIVTPEPDAAERDKVGILLIDIPGGMFTQFADPKAAARAAVSEQQKSHLAQVHAYLDQCDAFITLVDAQRFAPFGRPVQRTLSRPASPT